MRRGRASAAARRKPAAARRRLDLPEVVLWAAAGGAAFASLVGWAAPLWWGLALFEHFRIQYAFGALAVAIAAGAARRVWPALLAGATVLVNLIALLPAWMAVDLAEHHGAPVKLLELNVMQDNQDHARVARMLAASDADVVGLIEVDSKWLRDLAPVMVKWPYQVPQPHNLDKFGMALYSKRPFKFREVSTFGAATWTPSIVATIDLDGKAVTLVLIHPPPAVRSETARVQRKFYEALAGKRPSLGENLVVFGDFNATPWSYALRQLRATTGLTDSYRGFGLGLSWPAKWVPWRIPIDQALVSQRVKVLDRSVGDAVGSDHFPTTTTIALIR